MPTRQKQPAPREIFSHPENQNLKRKRKALSENAYIFWQLTFQPRLEIWAPKTCKKALLARLKFSF